MHKIDFKRELKELYQPPVKEVVKISVPTMNYLMADGAGDPGAVKEFREIVEVLFSLSYVLKFMAKNSALEIDYNVMPLEGLWWTDDMNDFSSRDKSQWKWTMMIMQPKFITKEMVVEAIDEFKEDKNPVALHKVRFEPLSEGSAAQVMHIGPFTEEGFNIERIHRYIDNCGFQRVGKHHEIYLCDIRITDPKKWKTVIRQPIL